MFNYSDTQVSIGRFNDVTRIKNGTVTGVLHCLSVSLCCKHHHFCLYFYFSLATRVVTWLVQRFSAGKFKSHQPNPSLVYSTDVFLKYMFVGHCSYVSTMKYCKECLKQRMKLATARASVRFESRPALTICRTVSELSKERKPIQNSFKS